MFDLIKGKIFWKGGKKPGFYQYVIQAKVDWRIQDRIEIKKEKMQLLLYAKWKERLFKKKIKLDAKLPQ